jgi:divalent metal cation (Fe/Co/Zn/Cd) transporter
VLDDRTRQALVRRGFALEWATLGWNVAGIIAVAVAVAVLVGLVLNAVAGWWWADPAAGYVLVYYAAREVREIFTKQHDAE